VLVQVSLLYIDDCPHSQLAEHRVAEALHRVGKSDQVVEQVLIASDEQARRVRFLGSPTILIDGQDPFAASPVGSYGLSCRLYPSEDGLTGSPTVEALVLAVTAHA